MRERGTKNRVFFNVNSSLRRRIAIKSIACQPDGSSFCAEQEGRTLLGLETYFAAVYVSLRCLDWLTRLDCVVRSLVYLFSLVLVG